MAGNDWRDYRLLVVSELERHASWLKSHETRIQDLRIRAALWGAAGGGLGGVAAAVIAALVVRALAG